jgi:hypothetical protein
MLKCSKLKQMVKDNGGFSINPLGECPKTGYMVSIKDLYKISLDLIDQDDINFASDIASEVNGYIGGWLDTTDTNVNNFYMDISINIQDKKQALKVARENGQLAIYDIEKNESIYL